MFNQNYGKPDSKPPKRDKKAPSLKKKVYVIKKTKRSSDYKKVYWKFFGYDQGDWISCEIPKCNEAAVDIHHLINDGMGGTKTKSDISNLMGLCREHHSLYGDRKQHLEMLISIHDQVILNRLKEIVK